MNYDSDVYKICCLKKSKNHLLTVAEQQMVRTIGHTHSSNGTVSLKLNLL